MYKRAKTVFIVKWTYAYAIKFLWGLFIENPGLLLEP